VEGSIDLKTALSLLMVVVSVVASSAVAKAKIKDLVENLKQVQDRLREMDRKSDKLWTLTETQEQRITILSGLNSPEHLRRDHMTVATLLAEAAQLRKEADSMHRMHNTVHPPVSNERKAD